GIRRFNGLSIVLPAWDRRVAELFDRERIFPIFQLDLGVLPDSSTIRQMAPTVGIWVVDLVSWSGSDLLEQSRRVNEWQWGMNRLMDTEGKTSPHSATSLDRTLTTLAQSTIDALDCSSPWKSFHE
ncbi:hypothetical protein PRIPAC_85485, partial [Pristionchus pacificus]|uniref:Uncharacterized protein n=1 Tax=Pristionchus pacificus TaxID=54126 RepID=A0A2A6BMG9_PRIPA